MIIKKVDRPIHVLVIHCAATRPSMDVGVKDIDLWHRARGLDGIGYHAVIRRSGKLEKGRPLYKTGEHVRGYNTGSIGVCMAGGVSESDYRVPEDNFTKEQWDTLKKFCLDVKRVYPDIKIVGHNQLDRGKACPSFYVPDWLNQVGL